MGAMQAPRPHSPFKEKMRAGWDITKADFRKMKPLVERLGKKMASRAFISDTTAGIIVSMAVCMPIEMRVGGMTFEQSLQARLTALPFAFALSGPYGMLREWFYRMTNVPYKLPEPQEYKRNRRTMIQKAKSAFQRAKDSFSNMLLDFAINPAAFALNQARKFLVDMAAFLVGQLPVYAVIVAASGANFRQVLMSSGAMLLASPIFGRPMGIWYDFVRVHFFHADPAGAKQGKSGLPQINE
jgi:hypothetical protein